MKARTRMAGLATLLAGAALSAGQAPAPPAQQTPTFKVEVNYVEVDALVTDKDGQFVRDLKKEDFQIFEDGKPQTVATFSIVDIPIEKAQKPLGAVAPIDPDVVTNARPFDGRVYVMVLDDLHTLAGRTGRVKRTARQFIEQNLGANDLMAVVHTSGRSDASQDFTGNKRLLLSAVDKVLGEKVSSATVTRTGQYYRNQNLGGAQPGGRVDDPEEMQRAFNARSTLQTLERVAEWFGGVRGRRKSIIFVSEGIDYDITNVFENRSASSIIDYTRDVIAAATRSNVTIYGIDPRGLTQLGDEAIEVESFPDDHSLGIGVGSLQNEVRLSQDSLRSLSEDSGGFAAVNRNEFGTAFARIVKDNSSYYVLAYYPPGDKRDGKFHKISVRVTRPGLTVQARKGYVSPKKKPAPAASATTAKGPSSEVREAVSSPLPVSGLTMRVFVAPFKGTQPNASVLFGAELLGSDLKLVPKDTIELSWVASDAQGKIRANNTDKLTLSLKPETKTLVEQTGLRTLNRMDIPPGRYQLRFAAYEANGVAGSVLYDLEVPDFNKGPLLMSGIVLTSMSGALFPTVRPDEQLRQVLPAAPTAGREFPQNDEITLFTEIYDNQGSSPHKVDISLTVRGDDTKVVYKADEERASSELQGKRGGYGYLAKVPLKDLVPGPYVLKVEARSRLGNTPTVSRELQFTVVAARPAAASR